MIENAHARSNEERPGQQHLGSVMIQADLCKANLRLIRLGLAAAKFSLRSCMHGLASQILERVALHIETPSNCTSIGHLCLQYSALRMMLVRSNPFSLSTGLIDSYQSWQQNRLDLAEHFFAKMDLTQGKSTPAVAEGLVDLLFEIGKSLLDQGCPDIAVIWLERAQQLLESHDIERLSSDASELRLNILHTYG